MHGNIASLVKARRLAGIHQILGRLGLAVDAHRASGERLQVDPYAPPGKSKVETLVHERFFMEPIGDAGPLEQRHGAAFQHAGADAAEDVLARAALDDRGADPGLLEELAEARPGGARHGHGDLHAHLIPEAVTAAWHGDRRAE